MTELNKDILPQDVFNPIPVGQEFDILLRFTKDIDHVELFTDDNVRTVIDALLKEHGKIVVKVNWFADKLVIIAPNK